MRLELGEVDLDDLVVLGALVGVEAEVGILVRAGAREVLQGVDVLDGLRAACSFEIASRCLCVREDGCGGTNFSTVPVLAICQISRDFWYEPHVTSSGHASCAERINARSEVLDDRSSTTTDCQLTCQA